MCCTRSLDIENHATMPFFVLSRAFMSIVSRSLQIE